MHPLIPGLSLLLIILTVAGCSQETQTPVTSDGVDFDLNLELVLDSQELVLSGQSLSFENISSIRAYGESGFIATDYHNKQVLQLDRDGNIIRRIGQEGRGPGEFIGAGFVTPLRDGRFGVYDSGNARIIIFDEEGNDVLYIDKQPEYPGLRAKVHPLEDGGYLYPLNNRIYYEEYRNCLFLELDADLRPLAPCYGSPEALNESDNEYLELTGWGLRDIYFIGKDRFIAVHRYYDGTHYFYRRTADNWVIDSTATGYVRVPVSVTNTTFIPIPDLDPRNPQLPDNMPSYPPNYTFHRMPEGEAAAVIWHNRSMGYEVYDGRYLLHFTVIDPGGDERIPGVELWTTDGTYLGYQRLDDQLKQFGFNEYNLKEGLRLHAFNDGRLVLATYLGSYIFDVNLVVSDQMAEDTVDK